MLPVVQQQLGRRRRQRHVVHGPSRVQLAREASRVDRTLAAHRLPLQRPVEVLQEIGLAGAALRGGGRGWGERRGLWGAVSAPRKCWWGSLLQRTLPPRRVADKGDGRRWRGRLRLGVHHGNPWSTATLPIATGRWGRGEKLRGWWWWWEVGALRWRGWEVSAGLLRLAHFGLECQGQVGQVEFAWFRGSRGSI